MISIIGTVITAVVLPLIALAGKKLIDYLNSKIKNDKLNAALTHIVSVAEKSADMIAQTFVDDLKKQGKFDAQAASIALRYAVDNAKKLITPELTNIVASGIGDIDSLLKTAIEAYIKSKKFDTNDNKGGGSAFAVGFEASPTNAVYYDEILKGVN